MSTLNHAIFDTLTQLDEKRPAEGLSLLPMEDGEGYTPEVDTGIVRVWGDSNSFVSPVTLAKTGGKS